MVRTPVDDFMDAQAVGSAAMHNDLRLLKALIVVHPKKEDLCLALARLLRVVHTRWFESMDRECGFGDTDVVGAWSALMVDVTGMVDNMKDSP